MIGKEDLEKWQAKLKGKDNFILTAMFLLPLFPDDVLCFIAGLSSMSNRYFVIMMLICRIIGVTATCYSIQILPFNTWWGLLGWGVIYAVVIVGFILFYKNIDKINAWIQRRKKQK
ncbi:MAG: VTT domain-containing protein, partial [Clostridia bacterium]|nr:VTT domain-containing protein [Clostridia bacterium]